MRRHSLRRMHRNYNKPTFSMHDAMLVTMSSSKTFPQKGHMSGTRRPIPNNAWIRGRILSKREGMTRPNDPRPGGLPFEVCSSLNGPRCTNFAKWAITRSKLKRMQGALTGLAQEHISAQSTTLMALTYFRWIIFVSFSMIICFISFLF